MEKQGISVVVPVYRGATYLRELLAALDAIRAELETEGAPVWLVEAIFVDDGSTDGSGRVLAELCAHFGWINVIELSRNFGQHPATIAGILHSSGDWVATLDEDLQHPPKQIVPLLKHAILNRLDIVYAKPRSAVHHSLLRDLGSRGFKALVARLTNNPHVKDFNSFRMMRGSIARAVASVCSHDPYLDISACWFTNKVGTLPIETADRRYIEEKKSGYTFSSLLRHAGRMMASSELKFLRLGTAVGFLALLGSLLVSAVVIVIKIFRPEAILARGWVSLVLLISFVGGLGLLLAGVLIELTSSLVARSKGKPTFFAVDRSRDRELLAWAKEADA